MESYFRINIKLVYEPVYLNRCILNASFSVQLLHVLWLIWSDFESVFIVIFSDLKLCSHFRVWSMQMISPSNIGRPIFAYSYPNRICLYTVAFIIYISILLSFHFLGVNCTFEGWLLMNSSIPYWDLTTREMSHISWMRWSWMRPSPTWEDYTSMWPLGQSWHRLHTKKALVSYKISFNEICFLIRKSIPEKEMFEGLRKQQSQKWAHQWWI